MDNNDNITINKKMLKEMGRKLCPPLSAMGLGSSFTQLLLLGYKTPLISILTFAICLVAVILTTISQLENTWREYNPKKQEQKQ